MNGFSISNKSTWLALFAPELIFSAPIFIPYIIHTRFILKCTSTDRPLRPSHVPLTLLPLADIYDGPSVKEQINNFIFYPPKTSRENNFFFQFSLPPKLFSLPEKSRENKMFFLFSLPQKSGVKIKKSFLFALSHLVHRRYRTNVL